MKHVTMAVLLQSLHTLEGTVSHADDMVGELDKYLSKDTRMLLRYG